MPDELNAEPIKELFKTYKEMMFKIAMGILHNESDAEDAVQDAFLSIINNFEKISSIPCIEKEFYFVTIIENISINKLNKKNTKFIINCAVIHNGISKTQCVAVFIDDFFKKLVIFVIITSKSKFFKEQISVLKFLNVITKPFKN